ncbi:MAG: MASE1 domain-containing protein [Candidatus Lutacidiplasmatales archaeon]
MPNGRGRWVRLALSLLVLGAAYFLSGKVGLFLAVGNASVSAVWPPTGIAIAALLLGDFSLWPAIFAGAFLVNLTTTGDVTSSLGIATGNTLEAVVGAYLALRFAGGKRLLATPRNVAVFALLSGFLAATVAATIGTTSLTLAHLAAPSNFFGVWGPWWLGDAIGAIEVTPLILAVAQGFGRPYPALSVPARWEPFGVAAVTVGLALVVFARPPTTALGGYPLIFLVVPPIIWAAVRFGPLGAVGSVSAVSVIAIVATVTGNGPFATLPLGVSLVALRIFIGSLAITALLVAAEVLQHHRLESELNHTRKELQRMLQERTAQLDAAKSLAAVGTWSYEAGSEKVVWSAEMYQILGYGDARFPVDLEKSVERLAPADRIVFLEELRGVLASSEGRTVSLPEHRYRVEFPNGERRTVLSQIAVTVIENGRPVRLSGTVQDISERQRIEDELRRLRSPDAPDPGKLGDIPMWMIPWMDNSPQ